MDYKYEFERLHSTVKQYMDCQESKAALAVLQNAMEYYESKLKNLGEGEAETGYALLSDGSGLID